jgi:hypothetical protein
MKDDREQNWDSLERISDLLYVKPDKNHELYRVWVPGEMHKYSFYTGKTVPSFVLLPRHEEIFYRLILRAALTENIDELDLKLSKC